jgi:hypothetical protein
VVVALKQPPALVRGLRAEFDAMAASLTVTPVSVEATGKKRPLRQDDVAASTKAVEARWGAEGKT